MTQRDKVALHCLLPVTMCFACATAIDESSDSNGRSDVGSDGASGGTTATGGTVGSGGTSTTGSGGSGLVGTGGTVSGSGGSGTGGVASGGSTGSGGSVASGGTTTTGGTGSGGTGSGGTAPSGTELFFDDFEAGSDEWISVPNEGWSLVSDGTTVFSQDILDTSLRMASAGDTSWTDQVVEARVKVLEFTGQSSSYQAAVHARFQNADNSYYVSLQSNGEVKIKKRSGGSDSSISNSADIEVSPDTWYTVRLDAVGTLLTAYIDDAPVLSVSDTSFASGGVGLSTKNATAMFDDVVVTTP